MEYGDLQMDERSIKLPFLCHMELVGYPLFEMLVCSGRRCGYNAPDCLSMTASIELKADKLSQKNDHYHTDIEQFELKPAEHIS